jgi:acetolactate synthase-1/2/3 large subunit
MTSQPRFRGADALALTLKRAGVGRVFALSGNHIMSVFDALFDAGIDIVHTRHEASAVHMADAWARITGTPGIALVTGGPGHANAVSALYTALMSETPVVLLSGHAPNNQAGAGAFQEMAQADMARPVTKAAWTSRSGDDLASDLANALVLARAGRPGPVNLNLPSDALQAGVDANLVPSAQAPTVQRLDQAAARAVIDSLVGASRPVILAGPSLMLRQGRAKLQELEDASGVPVIGMESPRGMLDPSLGAFAEVVSQADRVLLLGKRMDFTVSFGGQPAFGARCEFLQIDADEAEISRSMRAVKDRLIVSAVADAVPAIDALIAIARKSASASWRDEVKAAVAYRPAAWETATSRVPGRLHPVACLRPLQKLLDSHPDAVLVADGGEFGQWAQACLTAPHRILNGVGGSIGSALPFAMGARFAERSAPVVAVMGDGTFGFHAMELDTAVTHMLPFVAVVGNDARWNAEYQIQLKEFGANRARGCELRPLRYDGIASVLGAHGAHVSDSAALWPAIETAYASGLPAVIDVAIEGLAAPKVQRR